MLLQLDKIPKEKNSRILGAPAHRAAIVGGFVRCAVGSRALAEMND